MTDKIKDTSPDERFYEIVSEQSPIEQGDIVLRVQTFRWKDEEQAKHVSTELMKNAVDLLQFCAMDGIVVSQTCDLKLRNEKGLHQLILCRAQRIHKFAAISFMPSLAKEKNEPSEARWNDFISNISRRRLNHKSFLPPFPAAFEKNSVFRIIDFNQIDHIPLNVLERGIREKSILRIRLKAPWRDHISAAFAMRFIRVGLDENFKDYRFPSLETVLRLVQADSDSDYDNW